MTGRSIKLMPIEKSYCVLGKQSKSMMPCVKQIFNPVPVQSFAEPAAVRVVWDRKKGRPGQNGHTCQT